MITLNSVNFSIDEFFFELDTSFIRDLKNIIIKSKLGDYSIDFLQFDLNNEFLSSILNDNSIVIIDSNLINIYDLSILDSMIIIEASEDSKSFENINSIIDKLISMNVNKGSQIIAIGGGIIQDITSFSAAIFRRGIQWKYIPSTLLSQSDSCIGAKNALNYKSNKNLLGLFSAPFNVIINSRLINTLSYIDVMNGYGEIIKLGIIAGEFFFQTAIKIIFNDISELNIQKLIRQSLLIKKVIIEFDEFEQSVRQILNYGHSIGHAIEAESKFEIPHGIAVLIGILIENRIAYSNGLCNLYFVMEIEDCIYKILGDNTFQKRLLDLNRRSMFERIRLDKKVKENILPILLPKNYGNFVTVDLLINNDLYLLIENILDEFEHGFNN